jgi:hypothetical protein
VVLAAANSAVINELHGGWPWWAAAGVLTLAGAWLAGWLSAGAAGEDGSTEVGPGAVYVGGQNSGVVRTSQAREDGPQHNRSRRRMWRVLRAGSVFVGMGNTKTGVIETTGRSAESQENR